MDICLTEIDEICGERVAEYLVVNVHRSLWDGKKGALADVVFEPEVVVVKDAFVFERILLRHQIPS